MLGKPLLLLHNYFIQYPEHRPGFQLSIAALRLWDAFNNVTSARRLNILQQTASNFKSLLRDPSVFAPEEFAKLFGCTFINNLVDEAKGDVALQQVSNVAKHRHYTPNSRGQNRPYQRFDRQQFGQQQYNQQQQRQPFDGGGSFRGRYNFKSVTTRISPSSVPPNSLIGGRLKFFSRAWPKITKDQWILMSISDGFNFDLITHPRQDSFPVNPS